MNTFAWSITFEGSINTQNLWVNFVINQVKEWVYNIFLYWETAMKSSQEIFEYIKSKIIWRIINYDISISTEDKIKLFEGKTEWKYQLKAIHGQDFETVVETEKWSNIVAIREAEESDALWGRVIKVDYLV